MAKELPFFKFEPGQWDTGNIQLCSFEAQGVFINLCSLYWQRLGDLPHKLALQKVCGGNAVALDSLCEVGVIRIFEGQIRIDFLDEQLSEFENASKKNSENARSGWEKRRNHATALRKISDPNAIRGEKRREEKRRGEERREAAPETFEEIKISLFGGGEQRWVDEMTRLYGSWGSDEFDKCYQHHNNGPAPPAAAWQWKQKFGTWLGIKQKNDNEQRAKTKGSVRQNAAQGNGQPRKPFKWD